MAYLIDANRQQTYTDDLHYILYPREIPKGRTEHSPSSSRQQHNEFRLSIIIHGRDIKQKYKKKHIPNSFILRPKKVRIIAILGHTMSYYCTPFDPRPSLKRFFLAGRTPHVPQLLGRVHTPPSSECQSWCLKWLVWSPPKLVIYGNRWLLPKESTALLGSRVKSRSSSKCQVAVIHSCDVEQPSVLEAKIDVPQKKVTPGKQNNLKPMPVNPTNFPWLWD